MNKTAIFIKDNYEFIVLISIFFLLMLVFAVAHFILPKIGVSDVISVPLNTIQIDYNLLNSLPVYM